jgi:hypothetical protein
MTGVKMRDILLVLVTTFLLFLFFITLLLPKIFEHDPLLQGIFGWDCMTGNELSGVLCQFMFAIKLIVVVYLTANLIYFIIRKLKHQTF